MMNLRAFLSMRPAGAVLVVLATLAAGTAAAQQISPAETLLFETDHLARVKAPATLVYTFHKDSNVEPGYKDEVRLELARINGKLSATLHFLSGERKQDIPALEDPHGNPVLLGFLEHDIAEMKRLTGGSTSYFRKRIRMALAEGAQLSVEPVTYQGNTLQAQAVRIQPYLNDPMHARFEKYLHKTYTFVLSDKVPGGLYQLRSSLGKPDTVRTGAAPAAPPMIDETLTLISVTPKQP
jgi:hypothetical protein